MVWIILQGLEESRKLQKLKESRIEINADKSLEKIKNNLYCELRKISKEERLEEICCHGEEMGSLRDKIDENMLGGDYSRKAKNMKERSRLVEMKTFREK
jgi:hypothetical protein